MSTLDEVRRIMGKATRCNEHDITLDTALKDLKIDSLNWVQIIVGVESTFDVEIDVEKMRDFVTVGDFVKHIEELAT